LVFQHRGKHMRDGFALERRLAGQHFEQHDAECPEIAALVDGFACGLFGTHVGDGAEDDAGLGGMDRKRGRIRGTPRSLIPDP